MLRGVIFSTYGCCAQAHYRDYDKMTFARSVFVIHNIAHQGRGPMADLAPLEVRRRFLLTRLTAPLPLPMLLTNPQDEASGAMRRFSS
jgi:hypothetical protein